jgi:hypothetical protein
MTIAERGTTTTHVETAVSGSIVQAVGGVATIVLGILGLANVAESYLVPIEAILFGAVLLIYGSTMAFEHVQAVSATAPTAAAQLGSGVSAVFLAGAAGIVLGILGLLGIHPDVLVPAGVIVYGSALVLSSNATPPLHARAGETAGEALSSQMLFGAAGAQALIGLAAIVLGILALAGTNPAVLTLVAFLALGASVLISGSALTGAMTTMFHHA